MIKKDIQAKIKVNTNQIRLHTISSDGKYIVFIREEYELIILSESENPQYEQNSFRNIRLKQMGAKCTSLGINYHYQFLTESDHHEYQLIGVISLQLEYQGQEYNACMQASKKTLLFDLTSVQSYFYLSIVLHAIRIKLDLYLFNSYQIQLRKNLFIRPEFQYQEIAQVNDISFEFVDEKDQIAFQGLLIDLLQELRTRIQDFLMM